MKTIKQVLALIFCALCLLGVLLLFSAGMVEGDLPKLAGASLLTVICAAAAVWFQLSRDRLRQD